MTEESEYERVPLTGQDMAELRETLRDVRIPTSAEEWDHFLSGLGSSDLEAKQRRSSLVRLQAEILKRHGFVSNRGALAWDPTTGLVIEGVRVN